MTKPPVLYRAGIHALLIGASCLFIVPFLWMVSTSLKQDTQIFAFPPVWIPKPFMWANYIEAVNFIPFFQYLQNTAVITLLSVLGVVISCPLAAYSFAKLDWAGRKWLFAVTLAVMMIPGQVTTIPLFTLFHKLGLVGTSVPLVLHAFFGVPFYIFLLRQFFLGLPGELLDAARMDGAGELRIYLRIMLPLAMPAVLAVALFEFMHSWTDFIGPLLYLNDPAKYTLSLGIQQFYKDVGTEWGLMMAVSTLMTLPVIVLFFLLQKTFIQGVTFTGIKG